MISDAVAQLAWWQILKDKETDKPMQATPLYQYVWEDMLVSSPCAPLKGDEMISSANSIWDCLVHESCWHLTLLITMLWV